MRYQNRIGTALMMSAFVLCAGTPAGTTQTPPGPTPPASSTPAPRLPEETRQAIFADLQDCRADIKRRADEQSAKTAKPEGRGYSTRQRARYYQMRATTGDEGMAACVRLTSRKYALPASEVTGIVTEGTCKQWKPLSGEPTC